MTTSDRKYFIFNVKACSNAFLYLTKGAYNSANAYELEFGYNSNRETVIRRIDFVLQSVETFNVLSCTEVRTFWVQWGDKWIKSGQGAEIGKDTLIQYTNPDGAIIITDIGIGTRNGSTGLWELLKTEGKYN